MKKKQKLMCPKVHLKSIQYELAPWENTCPRTRSVSNRQEDSLVNQRAKRVDSPGTESAKRVEKIVIERAKRVDSLVKERAKRVNSPVKKGVFAKEMPIWPTRQTSY